MNKGLIGELRVKAAGNDPAPEFPAIRAVPGLFNPGLSERGQLVATHF